MIFFASVAGNWLQVVAELLRREGFQAEVWHFGPDDVPAAIRWCRPLRRLSYVLGRPFRKAAAIHCVSPLASRDTCRIGRLLGKRLILHWIGTDVMRLYRELAELGDRKAKHWCHHLPQAHFADSPELIEELASAGIKAELFRLLPDSIMPAEETPLPDRPAVLAQWSPLRRKFYGGEIVDGLAREFPDLQFYVVGSTGQGEPQHPNMRYLGRLDSLEGIYKRVSVLVRIPKHDSLSAMVLEMLARGRWVIYNKPFPHTELASNLHEARAALRKCLARSGPNITGRDYVRDSFSPITECDRVAPIYRTALGGTV